MRQYKETRIKKQTEYKQEKAKYNGLYYITENSQENFLFKLIFGLLKFVFNNFSQNSVHFIGNYYN